MALGTTPGSGEPVAVPVAKGESTSSTDARLHDESLTIAADRSLQVLELSGHIMLSDSDKPREIPGGRWSLEQHGADSLPHGSLSAVIQR